MNSFHNVLVGVDLDEVNVHSILDRACHALPAEQIEVVHVCERMHSRHEDYGSGAFANTEELDASVVADAQTRLRQLCDGYGIRDYKVLKGQAPAEIHAYANQHADLVVIGSHGQGAVASLFGSTSNATLHNTPCDVLTVHLCDEPMPRLSTYRRILVAVGLDVQAEAVIEHALRFSQETGTTLSLCHNLEGRNKLEQRAERSALAALAERFGIRHDQLFSLTGNMTRAITHLARAIDADLIVVGTHSKHGLDLLRSSTANSMLHGADYDTLAVHLHAA